MPSPADTSFLTTQVTTIIGQLHSIFDEIGVPRNERESRETELFSALSETLHNQLRQVTNEKHEMTEEAQRLATTIKQMEASLEDNKPNPNYEHDSTPITYPLTRCLQSLREKQIQISRLHKERYEHFRGGQKRRVPIIGGSRARRPAGLVRVCTRVCFGPVGSPWP